jgi:hypothetical protein
MLPDKQSLSSISFPEYRPSKQAYCSHLGVVPRDQASKFQAIAWSMLVGCGRGPVSARRSSEISVETSSDPAVAQKHRNVIVCGLTDLNCINSYLLATSADSATIA